jgi:hypothetical protein
MYPEERHIKRSRNTDLFLAYGSGERESPDLTSILGGNS